MNKIESFKINHLTLRKGLYVSRRDTKNGCTVTTFDLRITEPNREPVIDVPALHTIEHLGATFLRNSASAEDVVYFGPMGCRTGCYLVVFGDLTSNDVYDLIIKTCEFVENFQGEIPGNTAIECGNYKEHDLRKAKKYTSVYKKALLEDKNLVYPA